MKCRQRHFHVSLNHFLGSVSYTAAGCSGAETAVDSDENLHAISQPKFCVMGGAIIFLKV